MIINLVGKFSNIWGAEYHVKHALLEMGHEVYPFEMNESYAMLRDIMTGGQTIVLQGYGMPPKLIQSIRRITKKPVALWHAEVLSREWPCADPVVQNKAYHLEKVAREFDAIGHNCHTALDTVRLLSDDEGRNRVFWAPSNGVDARFHFRDPQIEKRYQFGFYGHVSPRRVAIIDALRREGIAVEWRKPEDQCFGLALNHFINECYVMLNLHYSETPNTETRLYESLGAGVPVISEPITMPELFPFIDDGLYVFDNAEELINLCRNAQMMIGKLPSHLTKKGGQVMAYLHQEATYVERCQRFLQGMLQALGHDVKPSH